MPTQSISLEIGKYREDPAGKQWDLPAWGHPICQGILPLFVTFNGCLIPVGTAFTIGRVPFIVSAAHNIREAWKYDERLNHLLTARELPKSVDLKQAGLSVLYQRQKQDGDIELTIWPIETIEGAPPTDVVFGFPQYQTSFQTIMHRVSFDLPLIGEKVWSFGYTGFEFPKDGIPLADVRAGCFDWQRDYRHRLVVVEGTVKRIFTQQFSRGFVEGSCFTFDAEVSHAQSGGPVMSRDGIIRGVNSAGASTFFGRPATIASLLYPLLFIPLRFGMQRGPLRINATRFLIDLVTQGIISTDGSEERVVFRQDEVTGSFVVNPLAAKAMAQYVHDDFSGYQDGRMATGETRSGYRLRKIGNTSADTASKL